MFSFEDGTFTVLFSSVLKLNEMVHKVTMKCFFFFLLVLVEMDIKKLPIPFHSILSPFGCNSADLILYFDRIIFFEDVIRTF